MCRSCASAPISRRRLSTENRMRIQSWILAGALVLGAALDGVLYPRDRRQGSASGRRLAAVPRHLRDRHLRRLADAVDVERGGRHERPLENRDPRPRTVEPRRLGGPAVCQHGDQRDKDASVQARPVRRHQVGDRRHAARMARLRAEQEDRRDPVAADGAHRRPEDQAAHEELATPTPRWRPTASASSRSSDRKGSTPTT